MPTLNTCASINIRSKCYKEPPFTFKHHSTSFTTHPTTSYTSTAITKRFPPNAKRSTTPEQSTSTAPKHTTLTTINTATPVSGGYASLPTAATEGSFNYLAFLKAQANSFSPLSENDLRLLHLKLELLTISLPMAIQLHQALTSNIEYQIPLVKTC